MNFLYFFNIGSHEEVHPSVTEVQTFDLAHELSVFTHNDSASSRGGPVSLHIEEKRGSVDTEKTASYRKHAVG